MLDCNKNTPGCCAHNSKPMLVALQRLPFIINLINNAQERIFLVDTIGTYKIHHLLISSLFMDVLYHLHITYTPCFLFHQVLEYSIEFQKGLIFT